MFLLPQLQTSARGRLRLPEVALARGPAAEGDTGDGSLEALYGHAWALVWDRTRPTLLLCQIEPGGLVEVEPSRPLPALTVPARHITLAFDGSARPMIAWQAPEGIYVRQWSGESSDYVLRGPYEGVDPVLLFDAVAYGDVPSGDVLLFYLAGDRRGLLARAERDSYAVEYELAAFEPPAVGTAWFLDQAAPVWQAWRFSLASDAIDPDTRERAREEWDLERLELVSDLYPYHPPAEALAVSAGGSGAYLATTDLRLVSDPLAVSAGGSGAYLATTDLRLASEALAIGAPGASGIYRITADVRLAGDLLAVTAGARGEYRAT